MAWSRVNFFYTISISCDTFYLIDCKNLRIQKVMNIYECGLSGILLGL